MISIKHSFLFVHVPKTGGNSIQNILKIYSEDEIVCIASHQDGVERFDIQSDQYNIHKHSSLQEYFSELGKELFENLFKFGCVRNPWERVISSFFSPHRGQVEWNRDRFIKLIETIPSTASYFRLDNQNVTDSDVFDNLDFVMHFENLERDFKKLCDLIGIPIQKLPIYNKSHREHYIKYYDEYLEKMVEEKFSAEISRFGYRFRSNK